ncbi:MAG: tRNA dihydrouridine synthase DusB [Gammaproteobacteria bacterium]|nr:tRNA dihydrouridine synthase DusB [Gammaproteobacteria bacterium]
MKIGPYQFENNLVLAPMAGVTDRPFRQLCKDMGAAIAVSEMVSANPLLRNTRKSILRLDHRGEIGLRWVQIAGSEASVLAEAAKYNVEKGADIIDINMGCPAKKVCRKAAGSALLADEGLVEDICTQVVETASVPVTLKIRTGTDHSNKNAVNIASIAEKVGISALTIHGRTRADKFQGEAEYKTIRAVREKTDITLIANGDIDSPDKALYVSEQTGADALMIGRAAQGRPWIFKEIAHFLSTGNYYRSTELSEIAEIMLNHIKQLHGFYGEYQGVRIARKHVGWYLNGYSSAQTFKRYFNQISGPKEQLVAITAWFEKQQLTSVS